MKTIFASAVFAAAMIAGSAMAQPFTFMATNTAEPAVNGVAVEDGMVAVISIASNGKTTFASGDEEEWASECQQFSSPNIEYDAQGFCVTTATDGAKLNIVMVCTNTGEEMGNANCWGYFAGGSGRWENAAGTVTWQNGGGKAWGGGTLAVPEAEAPAEAE